LFGVFIFSCGTTHLFSAITIWQPLYWLDGVVKAITTIVSVMAAVLLFKVIPAALRRSLGFEPEDSLIARTENGRLILEKADSVKRRIKARFAHLPPSYSLAEGLIAERREEAKREAGA
jgi:bifunctional DNA-binding transcriptional regulator/antitoxin component of YhaV-PrlF toxin-antitoxin module